MVGFINTSEILDRTFCICYKNSSGSESEGIGIIVLDSERDVVGDMEVEESGEVVAEEELIITSGPTGEEEAMWNKMSTASGKVATMA